MVGTYTDITNINVSFYGAYNSNQFLCVCDTYDTQGHHDGDDDYRIGEFTPASLSLNNGVLTLTPARLRVYAMDNWGNARYLRTSVYYVG